MASETAVQNGSNWVTGIKCYTAVLYCLGHCVRINVNVHNISKIQGLYVYLAIWHWKENLHIITYLSTSAQKHESPYQLLEIRNVENKNKY